MLAIEGCLPPLQLPFEYKKRLAGLRILCSPPEINPDTARLRPSVQTPSLHRHASDNMVLLRNNAGSRLPLPWLKPRPLSKNKAQLPLDAIPHPVLLLLGPDGLAPLPVTSQHLIGETYHASAPGRSYPQLKRLSHDLHIKEWEIGSWTRLDTHTDRRSNLTPSWVSTSLTLAGYTR